jgi:hypothetical protein
MSEEMQKAILQEALRRESERRKNEPVVTQDAESDGYGRGLARAIGQGVTFGFGDEIEAFLLKGDKPYEEKLAEVRTAMAQFAEQNPKTALGAELAGSIPTAVLGGVGLARAGVTGAAKIAGLEGAAYGFGAGEGGAAERAKSAVTSGAISAAGGKAADVVFPKVSEAAKSLMKQGVRLTPAQRVGGMTRAVEEKMKSIPFVGEIITSAEALALKDFNRASMNKVLKVLGRKDKVPQNLSGNEAYAFINEAVSDAYENVIPKLSANLGSEFQDNLIKIMRENQGLSNEALGQFNRGLQVIFSKAAGQNNIAGATLREIDSDLGSEASNFIRSQNATERKLGKAFFDVQRLLRDNMESQSKEVMGEYRRAQAAFKQMLPVRSAVTKASAQGGEFTPAKLIAGSRATDKTKDKIATAKGQAAQQQLAQEAQDVMGATIPNSGTADRAALMIFLDQLRQRPLAGLGYGLGGSVAAGSIYRTPMGRTLASGLLQTPRAAGTTLAPVTGSILGQSLLDRSQGAR